MSPVHAPLGRRAIRRRPRRPPRRPPRAPCPLCAGARHEHHDVLHRQRVVRVEPRRRLPASQERVRVAAPVLDDVEDWTKSRRGRAGYDPLAPRDRSPALSGLGLPRAGRASPPANAGARSARPPCRSRPLRDCGWKTGSTSLGARGAAYDGAATATSRARNHRPEPLVNQECVVVVVIVRPPPLPAAGACMLPER
jgi:hypothetical protein